MKNHSIPSIIIPMFLAVVGCGSVTSSPSKDSEPKIDTVTPDHGSVIGGTKHTLTGKNFGTTGQTIVVVGGHEATDVMVSGGTQLTFTAPPGDQEGGVVDVTVSNAAGFDTKPAFFTYKLRPVVLSVTPQLGKATGGAMITVVGRGFMDGDTPTVTIGGGTATNVTVVDDKTLTAVTAPVAATARAFTPLDVTVATGNGANTLAAAFRVTKQGLLVIDQQSPSRIFHVDLTTGDVNLIGTAGRRIGGCATNPTTGVLYGQSIGLGHELVTFDPLSSASMTIGPLNDGVSDHGLGSMTFNGNTLYGVDSGNRRTPCCSSGTGRLMTINTATGATAFVPGAGVAGTRANGIAPKDANNLYFVQTTNGSLDTVAIATSTRTAGLALSGGGTFKVTSAVLASNGTLYLLENIAPGGKVYSVNVGTAALTKFANVPTQSGTAGMCQTPLSY